jgi:hypothetical protein
MCTLKIVRIFCLLLVARRSRRLPGTRGEAGLPGPGRSSSGLGPLAAITIAGRLITGGLVVRIIETAETTVTVNCRSCCIFVTEVLLPSCQWNMVEGVRPKI